jgi:hypothetical protein
MPAETVGKLPYTGKKRGRRPKIASIQVVEVTIDGNEARPIPKKGHLVDLEADLDRLIFKLMSLGGLTEIEDSLRGTRRMLYGKLTAR